MWVAAGSTQAPNSATTALITVQGGFTVTVATSVTARNLVIVGGSTVSIGNAQTFTVWNGTANGTIADTSNNGILQETGSGNVLTVNGNNSYNGGTLINSGGTISVTNIDSTSGNQPLASGGITFATGGVLQDLSDVVAGNAQSYSGSIVLTSGTGVAGIITQLGIGGNTISLTGAISGGGGLVTAGSDVILNRTSGNNNIGAITVGSSPLFVDSTGSRLFINTINSINNSGITVENGAILDFELPSSTGTYTLTAANPLTFLSGAGLSTRVNALIVSTAIATFPTTGTMIFDQDDQVSLNITVTGNYPTLTGSLTIQVGGINSSVGTVTLSGAISGPGSITKTSTSELILGSANTYSGGTVVSAGELDAHVASSLGTGDVYVVNGATNQMDTASTMSTSARLILNSQSAKVNLSYTGTQNIYGLSTNNGTAFLAASTTYGATSSTATHGMTPPFTTGDNGLLSVGTSPTADAITVTAQPNTKVYDATTSSATSPMITSGSLKSGDTSTLSETYNTKDVPTGKTLTPAVVITDSIGINVGPDYAITLVNSGAGVITAKPLIMSGLSVPSSKPYDSTTTATVSGTPALQLAEAAGTGTSGDGTPYVGDALLPFIGTATGTYNSKDVAAATIVTFGGLTLGGAQAFDYTLTIQSPVPATITPRALSIMANSQTKTYGQTVTFGSGSTLFTSSGLQGTETITVALTCSGGAANAPVSGSPYTITPSAATGGSFNPANYTITYNSGTLTVNVLVVSLTGTRAYDGSAIADSSILSIANAVSGDDVSLSGSATLMGAATGTEPIKDVSGLTLIGTTSPNYTLLGYSGSVLITPIGPPIALGTNIYHAKGTALQISVTNLLNLSTSDSSGDPVDLVSVGGGLLTNFTEIAVTTNGSAVFYANPYQGSSYIILGPTNNNLTTYVQGEVIQYVVEDTLFPTAAYMATNYLTIVVTNAVGQTTGQISTTGATVTLSWAGIPGTTNVTERSTDLTTWTPIFTNVVPPAGLFTNIDTSPPQPNAYYELQQF
jgi:autotransporter-associated beta strand protein